MGRQTKYYEIIMRKNDKKLKPWEPRCFSTNFPRNFEENDIKCFVPLSDYRILEHAILKFSKGELALAELLSVVNKDENLIIEKKRLVS